MPLLKTLMLLLILGSSSGLPALPPVSDTGDSTQLPPVFIIGEHEAAFNALTLEYQTLLLTACDDNMDLAYDKWLGMLEEMEAYANLVNVDLKGVKMWINVFWDKKGAIQHIAYHLKPQSKNVDTRYLTAFLTQFSQEYRFPLEFRELYSHYGSASFPVFPRRLGGNSASDRTPSGNSLQNASNKPLVKEKY